MDLLKNRILFIVLFLILHVQFGQANCHYSCKDCTYPYHQYCKTCIDNYQLIVVKNPNDIPVEYRRNSKDITGICLRNHQITGVNVLGIILFVSALIFIPVTKSTLLFNITTTLQNFSLLGLIQIGWLAPVSYLFNAMQYFSPCNTFTRDLKQNSWEMKYNSFYYIEKLYVEPRLEKSFTLLGVLDIIVFLLIPLVHLARYIKIKYFEDRCRQLFCLSEWGVKKGITFLNCLYFFLIQETVLSFVVFFQFMDVTSFAIGTAVLYSIMTVLFCLHIAKFKITLFHNKPIQFYAITNKIIYPIFVVVPFQYQYFLIVLMLINCALEGLFDYKINAYPTKSRNTVFKALEFATLIMIGIFYAADALSVDPKAPTAFGYIVTIFLSILVGFFFLQIIFGIKQVISDKDKKKDPQNNTEVPQASVLQRENTGMISTKREEKRYSTQESFMEGDQPNKAVQPVFEEAPKAERSDTKQSLKKDKTDQKQSDIEVIQLQQSQIKRENTDREDESKLKNDHGRRGKNSDKFKQELRKRYGV